MTVSQTAAPWSYRSGAQAGSLGLRAVARLRITRPGAMPSTDKRVAPVAVPRNRPIRSWSRNSASTCARSSASLGHASSR